MRKNKRILVIALVLAIVCSFAACGKDENPVAPRIADYYTADIGVEWEVPVPSFEDADGVDVKVTDENGSEIAIGYGKVVFPAVGNYKIVYSSGEKKLEKTVKAVDTIAPQFLPLGDKFYRDQLERNKKLTLYGYYGEPLDLKSLFRATDNSGSCNVSYKALRGGVTPAVIADGTFTPEPCDYYTITATATDATGNSTSLLYKMYMQKRGTFVSFDYRNDFESWWFYNTKDQNNAQSVYARAHSYYDSGDAIGGKGQSYAVDFDETNTPSLGGNYVYRLVLNPVHAYFDFSEASRVTYRVKFRSDSMADGTAVPLAAIPAPAGVNKSTIDGINAVKVGEWATLSFANVSLKGKATSFDFDNNWNGAAKTYTMLIDDITVELPPEITTKREIEICEKGDTVDISELGISAVDGTTGEKLEPSFEVVHGGKAVAVEDGKFTLDENGVYVVTATAVSPSFGTSRKSMIVLAGKEAMSDVVKFNAAYSEEKGYYLEVPANQRLRLKDFLVTAADGYSGDIDMDMTVKNSAGKTVGFSSYTYSKTYEFITSQAGETYTVDFTAAYSRGTIKTGTITIYVTDEYSAADFDLLDVDGTSQRAVWINTSATKNCTYKHSGFTEYGFGYSLELSDFGAGATLGMFTEIYNSASSAANKYNTVKMKVYIATDETLTSEEIALLTPTPTAAGWTCKAYPTETNKWVEVEFDNATVQTHNYWVAGNVFGFGGTTKDSSVTVYVDTITYSNK